LAEGLAKSTGKIDTAEALQALPSPSKPGVTLGEQKAELFNRIRENFEIGRMAKLDGTCGGYSHNLGTVAGVLVQIEGGSDEAAKDVSMHIAAMRPDALSKDDLDPAVVEQEREYLRSAALKEGKPENIVDKMVEGRLQQFIAGKALLAQPYVKDDKQSVGEYAKSQGMTIKGFVLYILGQ
jgi:elongation factor Ts